MKTNLNLLLTLLLFLCALPARGVDKSNLYLVGDAAPCGWNNMICEPMSALGDGRFTWEGHLKAGQFRFLSRTGEWGESWFAVPDGDYDYSDGGGSPLWTGWTKSLTEDGNGNRLFKIMQDGDYRMVVDLGKLTVSIYKVRIYLIGDATSAGWNVNAPVPVWPPVEPGVDFTWTGTLIEGELKFLENPGSWEPCFTATDPGELLRTDDYQPIIRRDGYDDNKFKVPRGGTYTITFSDRLDMIYTSCAPDHTGYAFKLEPGIYIMAADMDGKTLHTAPLPSRLYIGTSAGDCHELEAVAGEPGRFSGRLNMYAGADYYLCYNPADFEASKLTPGRDLTFKDGARTYAVTPAGAGAYRFDTTGEWRIDVDCVNASQYGGKTYPTAPSMEVSLLRTGIPTGAEVVVTGADAPRVIVSGRTINVYDAEDCDVRVYSVAGRLVGSGAAVTVSPGVYLLKAGAYVEKVIVK